MKKDIQIPKVTHVEIAIVQEENSDWNVYILNKKKVAIETVIIVSQGFSETKTTSVFRRKIDILPENSYAKFELIQPELFSLENQFKVSFFEGNTLFDKTFVLAKGAVKKDSLQMIPMLGKFGVRLE